MDEEKQVKHLAQIQSLVWLSVVLLGVGWVRVILSCLRLVISLLDKENQ